VVLRLVYRDEPTQAERAERAWKKAVDSGGVLLTTTVLVELAWVLRVAAKFDRRAIASALRDLCAAQGVTVQNEASVHRALARYEIGAADFSDYVVLEAARDAGALPVITFDQRFARDRDVEIAAPEAESAP
jgi:predicted nucleic-acid-binding protein